MSDLCECGAELDALTDEAHAEGCRNRPSLRLRPTSPDLGASHGLASIRYDGSERVQLGMPTDDLLKFIEEEGLDVLVHAPRSRRHVEWTVAAWDYDDPQIAGLGSAETFQAALVASLQAFERCAISVGLRSEPTSTLPPPLPVVE